MSTSNAEPFTLFQREETANWSMRFSFNGKQIRKTLGVADPNQARAKAWTIWGEYNYKHQNGISMELMTVGRMAEEYVGYLRKEVDRGEKSKHHLADYPPVIRRYVVGYFGEHKDVSTIRNADLERYLRWRKDYWVTGPGKDIEAIKYERAGKTLHRKVVHQTPTISRLRAENSILKAFFDYGYSMEHNRKLDMPRTGLRARLGDNRRPSFTPEEYDRLIETSLERLKPESIKDEPQMVVRKNGHTYPMRQNGHVLRDRARLHFHIEVIAHTGLRPTEAKNLNWGDVLGFREARKKPLAEQEIMLQVWGKGKFGQVIPKHGAMSGFVGLWNLFVDELGHEPEDTDPVFSDHHGNRIRSYKAGFNELLKAAKLKTDYRGKARTTYSLRHFYISERIAEGTDLYAITTNTRTSVKMIENFYGQVDVRRFKNQLGDRNL